MIDWQNCKPEDFELQYLVEEFEEVGDRNVFAVNVFHKDGRFAFLKSVPIKKEYYEQLSGLDDAVAIAQLKKVIKSRVRDEINERIRKGQVKIEHKIALNSETKESL